VTFLQTKQVTTAVLRLYCRLRFEVLTAVIISMLVSWVVTPCELVGNTIVSENHTASIFRVWRRYASQQRWYLPASPHGITAPQINRLLLQYLLSCLDLLSERRALKQATTLSFSIVYNSPEIILQNRIIIILIHLSQPSAQCPATVS
jgi:hypothetical protein